MTILETPVTKLAEQIDRFHRPVYETRSAREAFGALLRASKLKYTNQTVLLPAYIGWSSREGSGVFDPITELGLKTAFYRLDDQLRVDLESLAGEFARGNVGAVLLIHYFGYVDPSYRQAVALARRHGALVIEDAAHALFSDWVGGSCGRLGDACLYSFHKMLPVASGGAFTLNGREFGELSWPAPEPETAGRWRDYDLQAIAEQRIENARILDGWIESLRPAVEPLWGVPGEGQFPQTYPVLIRRGSRDELYRLMNARGFGVVSLYHTMISAISGTDYPVSHQLAKSILNLPVHQDVSFPQLESMMDCLAQLVASR